MNRHWPLRKSDWRQSKEYFERRYAENAANAGYNEAEFQNWLLMKDGIDSEALRFLNNRMYGRTLHKMNIALGRMRESLNQRLQ